MRAPLALLVVAACGNNPGTGDDTVPDASTLVDGLTPDGWSTLIERSWTLPPNAEGYKCIRIKVAADMYISGFRALSPPGTHHEVLTISNTTNTVGEYDCTPANFDPQLMFAAGVNTDDLVFPQGVAVKLAANQYINLNLHLYNGTDEEIAAKSGVLVKTIEAADVVHEADMVFAGQLTFSIPPTNTPYDVKGGCSVPVDWHVFSLWPHMHQYATHQKLVVKRAGNIVATPLDTTYDFVEQKNYPMGEMLLNANDQVEVTCTYINDTNVTAPPGQNIQMGDSSNEEMCFTGMYKYPTSSSLYACASM
jgi:hypothetical protein